MYKTLDTKISNALQRMGAPTPRLWNFFARFALYAFIFAGLAFAWAMPFVTWATTLVLPAIGCYVATLLVQIIVRRPRPRALPDGFQLWIHTYSFPSAHASTSFACAVLLSGAVIRVVPELVLVFVPAAFFVALGIAVSRVVVGVHYPSDVVAGMLFGTLLSGLFLYFTVLA